MKNYIVSAINVNTGKREVLFSKKYKTHNDAYQTGQTFVALSDSYHSLKVGVSK